MSRRSRSRSRRGRYRDDREGLSKRQHRSQNGGRGTSPSVHRHAEHRTEGARGQKSGQQKAREAIDKEKEKARLKKLEREKAQQERALNREKEKERRREEAIDGIEKRLVEGGSVAPHVSDADRGLVAAKLAALAAPETATQAVIPPVSYEEPAGSSSQRQPSTGPLDEDSIRKLFRLLDRNGKNELSQRDVLVALRRHPAVRRLFGLPDAEDAEARLLAIQDAFEAGSGLGEIGPLFEQLRAGAGGGAAAGETPPPPQQPCRAHTLSWDAFQASLLRRPAGAAGGAAAQDDAAVEALQVRAAAAAELLPREHHVGVAFVATREWQRVPEGAACPGGLEYKMDMETGTTLARLAPARKSAAPRAPTAATAARAEDAKVGRGTVNTLALSRV